jgi:hypothetical protein
LALESSCASLMAFESVREVLGKPAFDVRRVHEQLTQAIQTLRQTIMQLRLAQAEDSSMLAPGFFVRSDPLGRRGRRDQTD